MKDNSSMIIRLLMVFNFLQTFVLLWLTFGSIL
jgi:hypothetical protein